MVLARTPQFTTEQFIAAIDKSGGLITSIAARVGCSWNTAKKYIEQHPTVKAAYENECERINDLAQSTIMKAIQDGDASMAKWWLAKKRKQEFGDQQANTNFDIDLSKLTTAQLERIARGEDVLRVLADTGYSGT